MVEEDIVSGEGWMSDDSSFYGEDEEQDRLRSLSKTFRPGTFWSNHPKDLNVVLATTRALPPPDLHNIYEGQLDAWQLNEPIDDFIKRLPPRTTSLSTCPWIWVASPYPEGRPKLERTHVQDQFIPRGRELLQQGLQERNILAAKNSQKTKGVVTRILNQESEALKLRIVRLAEETNVLAGKWMLFPTMEDLTRMWRMVVEGTITNRLGTSAKVATDEGGSKERLICVYTRDFRDTKDVRRVLNELVLLGLVKPGKGIFYKSDAYTYLDLYGKNAAEYGLQASIYSSQKMLASTQVIDSKPAPQKKQSTLTKAFRRSHDDMDTD